MITNYIDTVNAHVQRFQNSCATSLCELLIKLEGEGAPDLQTFESVESTGLDHIKDKTYGRISFRKHDGGSVRQFVESEISAGRAAGLFIRNDYLFPNATGVHGWAAVATQDFNGPRIVVLVAKHSENGGGEGRQTIALGIPLAQLDAVSVTDAIRYELGA